MTNWKCNLPLLKKRSWPCGCARVLKLADGVSSDTPALVLDPGKRIQFCMLFIANHNVATMIDKGGQIKYSTLCYNGMSEKQGVHFYYKYTPRYCLGHTFILKKKIICLLI